MMRRFGAVNPRAAGFARATQILESGDRDGAINAARNIVRMSEAFDHSARDRVSIKAAGYDGEPPEFRTPRNRAEWEKNKEPIPDFNANTDRLEWLLAHK